MSRLVHLKPITAIVYADKRRVDPIFGAVVDYLTGQGLKLAGYVQRAADGTDGEKCDVVLENIQSKERISISEKRGPLARGCKLDVGELLRAAMTAAQVLEQKPDLIVINKFGKTEAEGGGFRSLIVDSISRGVPVLIAVPDRNLESWNLFSDGLANNQPLESLTGDASAICAKLGFVIP